MHFYGHFSRKVPSPLTRNSEQSLSTFNFELHSCKNHYNVFNYHCDITALFGIIMLMCTCCSQQSGMKSKIVYYEVTKNLPYNDF